METDYGTDYDDVVRSLQRAVSQVESTLPDGVEPSVMAGGLADFPIVMLSVSSPGDVNELAADLEDVAVPEGALRFFDAALSFPGYGAFAQLLHAAIDVGIATSALDAALELTRQVNPDPLTSHLTGELVAQRFAAESVVEKAGRNLDELWASGGTDTSAEASLQVAAAKVTTGALTVDLASRIHELTGTRGTAGGSNLDRHWRELRTHTLHEGRRDKLATLGCAALTGENPPAGPKF